MQIFNIFHIIICIDMNMVRRVFTARPALTFLIIRQVRINDAEP